MRFYNAFHAWSYLFTLRLQCWGSPTCKHQFWRQSAGTQLIRLFILVCECVCMDKILPENSSSSVLRGPLGPLGSIEHPPWISISLSSRLCAMVFTSCQEVPMVWFAWKFYLVQISESVSVPSLCFVCVAELVCGHMVNWWQSRIDFLNISAQ